jgi:hypothetical protein
MSFTVAANCTIEVSKLPTRSSAEAMEEDYLNPILVDMGVPGCGHEFQVAA